MRLEYKDILSINFSDIVNINGLQERVFNGISIDSRTIKKGEIFFALRGKNSDGHNYLIDACRNGAAAIVIDKKYFDTNGDNLLQKIESTIIVVKDTLLALGELANVYRKKFNIPVIAIAGSNGKTTTKEMIASVLSKKYNVLSSEGNYNNQIGVPLTIFRLNEKHEIAVFEIGTNKFGEIKYLCKILEPEFGLITNIGNEHLEFFKTIKGVAKEELSLFEYLSSKEYQGYAFVNSDYKEIKNGSRKLRNKITYGIKNRNADIIVNNLKEDNGCYEFTVVYKNTLLPIKLNIKGFHNVENSLAAAAVGFVFGVPAKKIKNSLESFKAVDKRMEVIKVKNTTIINDTYNANLDSTLNALEVLNSMKTKGKKIFIFGDMLELGKKSVNNHAEIGKKFFEYAKRSSVPMHLVTYGKGTKYTNKSAGDVLKSHFTDKQLLIKYVNELVNSRDLVLVKGSRGMKMEEVVNSLLKKLR